VSFVSSVVPVLQIMLGHDGMIDVVQIANKPKEETMICSKSITMKPPNNFIGFLFSTGKDESAYQVIGSSKK